MRATTDDTSQTLNLPELAQPELDRAKISRMPGAFHAQIDDDDHCNPLSFYKGINCRNNQFL
jgi:hypothetical protein